MANNYFVLTLDTTPPELTLIVPEAVALGLPIQLGFTANEDISAASCWLIDGTGTRTDLALILTDGAYLGSFIFTADTLGDCTLYAQATDTVGNQSAILSAGFTASEHSGGYGAITAIDTARVDVCQAVGIQATNVITAIVAAEMIALRIEATAAVGIEVTATSAIPVITVNNPPRAEVTQTTVRVVITDG